MHRIAGEWVFSSAQMLDCAHVQHLRKNLCVSENDLCSIIIAVKSRKISAACMLCPGREKLFTLH